MYTRNQTFSLSSLYVGLFASTAQAAETIPFRGIVTTTGHQAGSNKVIGDVDLKFNQKLSLAHPIQMRTLPTSFNGRSRVTLVLSSAIGGTALRALQIDDEPGTITT